MLLTYKLCSSFAAKYLSFLFAEVPRFTARPSNTVLLVGDSMDIQCRATGDPKPRIKWSKRRGKIPRR